MADLSIDVDGLKFVNPFVIGSGPPGSNANTINRAFKMGWGGVVCKTISMDATKVHNTAPRYAKLWSGDNPKVKENVWGFENIELISDRPFDDWLDDFKKVKDQWPDRILICSIMEEYEKARWQDIVGKCQDVGVDSFELNLSCPHGLPERKMGMAMGENPDIVKEVCEWAMEVAKVPVWAKMTPNVTHITDPAASAFAAGCHGVSAINTILSVMGVDLDSLRPMPTVEGHSVPGGYSCKAVRPITLRMVMQLAKAFPDKTISGIGGVETGEDAAQFILLGAHTVQVCTGVMLYGYKMVKPMIEQLSAFMEKHSFEKITDFHGHSLPFFTTHADLVQRQRDAKAKKALEKDSDWQGETFVEQSEALTGN